LQRKEKVAEIVEFLAENPEYEKLLSKIVEWEDKEYKCRVCGSGELELVEDIQYRCRKCGNDQWIFGFQWSDVAIPASKLTTLVLNNILRVTHKPARRSAHYALVDREATKEALKEFRALIEEQPKEERVELPDDLFSVIIGYDDIKKLIKKALTQDKPVGFLFVGPAATAKSLFLEELNRLPGSSYHLGSSSTKAGLTQFLLEAKPRILLLDELDKMDRHDYAALLSLMESGKVVETKYGRRREEHMKVWVFASCNRLDGIPPENISRFRPYVFHFRQYTKDEFIEVAKRTLVEREGLDPELADYIAKKVSTFTRDVRAARNLARICRNKKEVDEYVNIIRKYEGFT